MLVNVKKRFASPNSKLKLNIQILMIEQKEWKWTVLIMMKKQEMKTEACLL